MTNIYHREYYDRLLISIEGHNAYAEQGKNIVCAAVSVLAYTLINCMLDEEAQGNVKLIRNIVRDGFVHLEIEYYDFSKERVKGILDACLTGFLMLEESYPKHVAFR